MWGMSLRDCVRRVQPHLTLSSAGHLHAGSLMPGWSQQVCRAVQEKGRAHRSTGGAVAPPRSWLLPPIQLTAGRNPSSRWPVVWHPVALRGRLEAATGSARSHHSSHESRQTDCPQICNLHHPFFSETSPLDVVVAPSPCL